jgi:deoxyribonuclease-1-like protein
MAVSLLVTGAGLGGWALHHTSLVRSAGQNVRDRLSENAEADATLANKGEALGRTAPLNQSNGRWQRGGHVGAAGNMIPSGGQTAAGDPIRIASFNIQIFGASKIGKPEVMDILTKVVRRFDIVAIQEIRDKNDLVMPAFVRMINADRSQYAHVIGPRLGRSVSTEQYAFVYDQRRIEVDHRSVLTLSDPADHLHREPLIARFRVRSAEPSRAFSFWLMNIHTDPDEASAEVDALADGFISVQQQGWGEDDVIILGDLNLDERHLGHLGRLPGMRPAIVDMPTNTRGNRTYDNLLFDSRATTEFTGQAGVINLMQEYGLTQKQALEVSDHLPIWATFSPYEGDQPGRLVQQPSPSGQAGGRR